ncbi:MAG: hypothetical protein ACI8WB_001823 [Phenylobacterium sp.]|jgi:hypothetical protein
MLKNDPDGPKMSTFLGKRVMYSAILLLIIILAMQFGLITQNPRPA